MRTVCFLSFVGVALVLNMQPLFAGEPAAVSRVLELGKLPDDARLGTARTLRDAYHSWTPPSTKEAWEKEAHEIRERVLVSVGLWPMPPKTPLQPVIHDKIDRGDYSIEKVYFASLPGHYVSGSLYRPKKSSGKIPGVLCPHGHWRDGRFYDAGPDPAAAELASGAEEFMSGARYPLQARMVQLARMGCVVFHYDMVGYADSQSINHRTGFGDAEAGLRLQNWMGLQTFNSIRALDFLLTLPEVDPQRIGVTGASGGGTQTFILCAIDPRPTVAFPAVMVSTGMQGGCVCENAPYLRIGINNIAISAVFAPKPLAMSGADDWTIDIETKGLPELKQVYGLFGQADMVHAKCFPQFKHNYNEVSREQMFDWFNAHLTLGLKAPVVQQDFWPVSPEELRVFDKEHPVPADAKSVEQLRQYLTQTADEQFAALIPQDADGLAEYRRVVGTAARVMLDEGLSKPVSVALRQTATTELDGHVRLTKGFAGRDGAHEQIPFVVLTPAKSKSPDSVVLWIDGKGKSHLFDAQGAPTAAVKKLLEDGVTVASADVFLTGEFAREGQTVEYPKVDAGFDGYTIGYNRPVVTNRVRDILTVLRGLADRKPKSLHLVGTGDAGPWALLARAVSSIPVDHTLVDLGGRGLENAKDVNDPLFLPGALKYGGIGGLAAVALPTTLTVAGTEGVSIRELLPLTQVNKVAEGHVTLETGRLTAEQIAAKLLQ